MSSEIEPCEAPVVLADDDADDRYLILQAVRRVRAGLRLATVCDGIELLQHLRERRQPPALVLLDLNMPRMDGREVLHAVRAEPRFADLRMVVMTTSVEKDDEARASALGAVAFLSKPAEFSRLMALLDALFARYLGPALPRTAA
jgi:CheY-like chemotaxis protein